MDVFLSLYVLGAEGEGNMLFPFLLAADDEDHAVDISDTFVAEVERLGDPASSARERQDAREEIAALRPYICLLQEGDEVDAVMDALRENNPNFETEIQTYQGGMFTVEVTTDAGFAPEAATLLRNRMCGHRVLESLSVEIQE